ncbi:MAG TPA: cellulase family glycosylhydrolase [Steroidobacteraceae bacterium]
MIATALAMFLCAPLGAAEAAPAALAVGVRGNHLVNGAGQTLQLRGANISGLENTPIQGWAHGPNGYNNWGDSGLGTQPDWSQLAGWHMNVVRLPLNEASWLGYECTDPVTGAKRNPDPGGNYRATVQNSVSDAVAAGMYVILDLHWSAPAPYCPIGQTQMADHDHSLDFWRSVAQTFKTNPAVIFELFNEPFGLNRYPIATSDWVALRDGGIFYSYVHQDSSSGSLDVTKLTWQAAGMQAMLDEVRATGATNVVLSGTMGWNGDLRQWVVYAPSDPIDQMAVAWHVYPWNKDPSKPAWSGMGNQYVAAVNLATRLPIVITESGMSIALERNLLPWADAMSSVSYLLWSWNPWGKPSDLIKDAGGTPTEIGSYYRAHLGCVAAGARNCP